MDFFSIMNLIAMQGVEREIKEKKDTYPIPEQGSFREFLREEDRRAMEHYLNK